MRKILLALLVLVFAVHGFAGELKEGIESVQEDAADATKDLKKGAKDFGKDVKKETRKGTKNIKKGAKDASKDLKDVTSSEK